MLGVTGGKAVHAPDEFDRHDHGIIPWRARRLHASDHRERCRMFVMIAIRVIVVVHPMLGAEAPPDSEV